VNHPPHAKMKHTKEADALVTEFAARWHAEKKNISANYIQHNTKKRRAGKG